MGKLSAFVCRKCGKTEWFVAHPDSIKIDDAYGTRLIQGAPTPGPYR